MCMRVYSVYYSSNLVNSQQSIAALALLQALNLQSAVALLTVCEAAPPNLGSPGTVRCGREEGYVDGFQCDQTRAYPHGPL